MKLKRQLMGSILLMCMLLVGCGGNKLAKVNEDSAENIYNNTISEETKKHARDFSSLEEQYSTWKGTHVNNMFEYAWVTVEPYVSDMNEYIEKNDSVDWDLVVNSNQFQEKVFEDVAQTGYNFVRIPLDTRFFFTDDDYYNVEATGQVFKGDSEVYNVDNWKNLDRAIEWCIDRNMHVCIDVHSTPGGYMIGGDEEESRQGLFSKEDDSDEKLFLKFWQQAAQRYADIDEKALSFNLYNEPPNFMHERQDDYIDLMLRGIETVRTVSPNRLIFIDTLDYSTAGFDNMEKFSGVDHLIFSFHFYSYAQWSTEEMLNEDWKSDCDERISYYNDWATEHGVKWMLQEYGIQSDLHEKALRTEYLDYVVSCVKQYNVPYCHYGFATGTPFNLYDGENITEPELIEFTVK